MVMAAIPKTRLLPGCEEKQRLRILYDAASKAYATAVNNVLVVRGKTTQQEYDRVRGLADEARIARSAARQALRHHIDEHGC
jgi:hypothetical protein